MGKKASLWARLRLALAVLFGKNVAAWRIIDGDRVEAFAKVEDGKAEDFFTEIVACILNVMAHMEAEKQKEEEPEQEPEPEQEVHPSKEEALLDRLKYEQYNLKRNYYKLKDFMSKGKDAVTAQVGEAQYDLLRKQKKYMGSYLHVLTQRINMLEPVKADIPTEEVLDTETPESNGEEAAATE